MSNLSEEMKKLGKQLVVPNIEKIGVKRINSSILQPPDINIVSRAESAYKTVKELMLSFEKSLSPEEEVGLKLVSFGNNIAYYIASLNYRDPDIIIFNCIDPTNEKNAVTLIQHFSQLNVLLLRLPKASEGEARRIGFEQK